MSSGISFYPLPELAARFKLAFRPGHIVLEGQRMVLLHAGAMGALRRELIESLGVDRARGMLMRMGYAAGRGDAAMVRRRLPEASDAELLSVGPQLHALEGVVQVVPRHLEIDIVRGAYHGEFVWEDSYEAALHLELFGTGDAPVCWMQLGYASGYTSELMGRPIIYRELECRGRGDAQCRVVGRPVADWGNAIDDELACYQPQDFAGQFAELQDEVRRLRRSLEQREMQEDMIGISSAFRESWRMVRKAAQSKVTVLLLGETGVGKEMYARALHRHSPRAGAPFVALNCAAIPDELIEAELFGVEKGAYTGAQQSRQGRFERADGGTLFLDEVGELSPAAQAKLLRVLQEGEFERVGDQTIRHADVRLVAATNLDLAQAVAEGRFRADLYYRLNIYPVRIAPLRERREDIPPLVEHFLAETCARYEKRMPGITERAMKALVGYDWPGNVRELRNTIERSVILLEPHERIDLKHIDPGTAANAPPPAREHPAMVERDVPGASGTDLDALVQALLDSTAKLDELEPRLIELAVRRAKGNLSQAARDLGMTRPQLAYRMNKHGIVFDGGAERGGRRH